MTDNDIRPLDGVRVLELGNYIAAVDGRQKREFSAANYEQVLTA